MLAFIFLTVGEPPVRHEWIWLNGSDTTVFLKTCIKQCLRCFAGGIPFIKFKMFTLCATSFFLFYLFFPLRYSVYDVSFLFLFGNGTAYINRDEASIYAYQRRIKLSI